MKVEQMECESNIVKAINILDENSKVLYGIFGMIDSSGYFPPCDFLNEFLFHGSDPCDQDYRMGEWKPFILTTQEYDIVKKWWCELHPKTIESHLDCECWDDWTQKILIQYEV